MKDQKSVGRVLGDINPEPERSKERSADRSTTEPASPHDRDHDETTHDASEHAGTRDVRSGGTGTVAGGSRNYRTGSGATGSDIGNRPE